MIMFIVFALMLLGAVPDHTAERNDEAICPLLMIRYEGKFGFIDTSGAMVIPPRWRGIAGTFSHGLCGVSGDSGWTYIDRTGEPISDTRYALTQQFSEGLGLVYPKQRERGRPAYIDSRSNVVLELADVQTAESFKFGMAKARTENGLCGFIDKSGEWCIPPRFREARFWVDGLCAVREDSLWGFIGTDGHYVLKPTYGWVEGHWWDGLSRFKSSDSLMGLQDRSGNVVIPPLYKWLGQPSEGLIAFSANNDFGYLRYDGSFAFAVPYSRTSSFNEGLAVVSNGDYFDGPFGYIDTTGSLTIPMTFQKAKGFFRGVAPVRVSGRGWGLIDHKGNFVVEPSFAELGYPLEDFPHLVQVTIPAKRDSRGLLHGEPIVTYLRIDGDLIWMPE